MTDEAKAMNDVAYVLECVQYYNRFREIRGFYVHPDSSEQWGTFRLCIEFHNRTGYEFKASRASDLYSVQSLLERLIADQATGLRNEVAMNLKNLVRGSGSRPYNEKQLRLRLGELPSLWEMLCVIWPPILVPEPSLAGIAGTAVGRLIDERIIQLAPAVSRTLAEVACLEDLKPIAERFRVRCSDKES